MAKRVSKAKQTSQLVVYCVEQDSASIANATFLLAAFLLIVVGETAAQAAERFTGSCAPYFLAPFRDASFRRQVASHREQPPHAKPFISAHALTAHHAARIPRRGDPLMPHHQRRAAARAGLGPAIR